MKTDTSCMLPVLGCLEAAQKFIQEKTGKVVPAWNASNDRQKEFLAFYGQFIGKLNVPELENKASEQVSVINDWLKARGYDIQLKDSGGPDGFAVASILDVLMKWIAEGAKTSVKGQDGKTYPA